MATPRFRDQGPTFWQPVLFSLLLGAALACAIQGLAITRAGAATEGDALDVLSYPVTQPLVHIVVLPACFFFAYAATQIAGYRAEIRTLRRGGAGWLSGIARHVAGRWPALSEGAPYPLPHAYGVLQRRNDRRLLRPVEFGAGALTMLGLLGTIIGLSRALRDLPAVMVPDADIAERTAVLGNLGFAFVTTIAGIVASLGLSLARVWLRNMADRAEAIVEDRAGGSP